MQGGLLFLGKSEAVPAATGCSSPVDKPAKIYNRVGGKSEVPRATRRDEPAAGEREHAVRPRSRSGQPTISTQSCCGLAPDSILVDEELHIKHVYGNSGASTSPIRPGEATQDITKLVRPEMGLELTALFHRAQRVNAAAQGRRHEIALEQRQLTHVQLKVVPLTAGGRRRTTWSASSDRGRRAAKKERSTSLAGCRASERLHKRRAGARRRRASTSRRVIEEQETSNEELQALNEELQSANEELQSSNEELETTNEELQSANEELTTVNQELNVKIRRAAARQPAPARDPDGDRLSAAHRGPSPQARQFQPGGAAPVPHRRRRTSATPIRSLHTYIDLKTVARTIDEALTAETEPSMQFTARDRSFEVQVQLFRGVKDTVEGAVVSFVENTEIVTALEESRVNRERLSSILESTPAIVTMKDLSGVYMYANRRFCEVTGRRPRKWSAARTKRYSARRRPRRCRSAITKWSRGSARAVRRAARAEREDYIWSSSKFPLFDTKKRVQSVCSVSLDMTERLGYEQQLELFKRAVSASNNGIVLLEEEGDEFRIAFASDRVPETIGIEEGNIVGLTLRELLERIHLKMRAPELETLARQICEQPEGHFTLNLDRSGRDAWVDVRSGHAHLKDKKSRDLILNFFDVTGRIEDQRTIASQQEELTKFSRFSALAQIASGIAHEINTPLNVITTKTDYIRMLAKQEKLDGGNALKLAEEIDHMVRNVSSIVHGLRSVAMRDSAKFEIARFKRIVLDTVKICEFRLQRFGVEVKLDLPQKDLLIKCYPVQIAQILINLLNNAVDAIEERSDRWVAITLRSNGDTAQLRVTDSGDGIDAEIAEKVMTPFFTTKKDQKGTGIGLSLSRSIARRHNGETGLDTESRTPASRCRCRYARPRRGAPASRPRTARNGEERGPGRGQPRPGRKHAGAARAERLQRAHLLPRPRPPRLVRARTDDVVVTDYYLPDMNGVELIRQPAQAPPAPARMLVTGSREELILKAGARSRIATRCSSRSTAKTCAGASTAGRPRPQLRRALGDTPRLHLTSSCSPISDSSSQNLQNVGGQSASRRRTPPRSGARQSLDLARQSLGLSRSSA